MTLAVISDLHLGSEDVTDSFGHDDAEFLRFLTFLENNFERVVLLGDIWETLVSRCPWRARRALTAARERHPEIARRFSRPRYKYIHGNHDLVAGAVEGAPERWSMDLDGKRLLFMHGHGHDRLIQLARHVVELGVCLGGWLRRAGFHRLYQRLDELDQKRSRVLVFNRGGKIIRTIGSRGTKAGQLLAPSAVAVSAAGVVYVADTMLGRLWGFDVASTGELAAGVGFAPGRVICNLQDYQLLDSLAVEAGGKVCVATIINGGITAFDPSGTTEHYPFPDLLCTNICFGGDDMRTAWVTASSTGKLYKARWPRPGLKLNFNG